MSIPSSVPSSTQEPADYVPPSTKPGTFQTDSKGRLKYDTKHWVDLTNRGDQDAENVMVTAANDNSGFYGVLWERPSTIHAGQTRRINLLYTMATTDPRLQVTWTEEGEEKEKVFDVG